VGSEGERAQATEKEAPKACPSCRARYPADALFCSIDGAPLTTFARAFAIEPAGDPYVGREVLGHIEIRQLVGLGATGRVYRAFQRGIDRDVAVKILHRELSMNEAVVGRFRREAKVASRLAHPNVVQVLLVGELPDGATYIVMEYLAGLSLQSALAAAGGAIPLPRALNVVLQICEAAGEAHARGVVHRDLKPDNVMLVQVAEDRDFVKVLDFGIARINWGEPSMTTAPGLIFGTPRYISPEGAKGERVGPPSDVYSIATILYQMLAGRTPFEAKSAADLLDQRIRDEPPPIHRIARAAYVPVRVTDLVMRNLSRVAADRAQDARAFARALIEAASLSGLGTRDVLARGPFSSGGQAVHGIETVRGLPPEPALSLGTADRASFPLRAEAPSRGAPGTVGANSSLRIAAGVLGVGLAVGGLAVALGPYRSDPTREPAREEEASLDALPVRVRLADPRAWETRASSRVAGSDSASPLASAPAPPSSAAAPDASARAVLDVSSPTPGLGQPVDFAAHLVGSASAGRPRWDFARFRISGPGLVSGTDLPTSDDGSGVFRSTFTFLQAGRFEIDFGARGPTGSVRAARAVVVSKLNVGP
jgi:tRNA A-37 threonylcarbamoyl transferase component Bud32